jgi:transcriptional regulator with XRE-family HTH domain
MSTIAELLRRRREQLGLSARAVSMAAGASESVVGKLEAGSCQPSLRVFAGVVQALGLNDREIALLVRLAASDRSARERG